MCNFKNKFFERNRSLTYHPKKSSKYYEGYISSPFDNAISLELDQKSFVLNSVHNYVLAPLKTLIETSPSEKKALRLSSCIKLEGLAGKILNLHHCC